MSRPEMSKFASSEIPVLTCQSDPHPKQLSFHGNKIALFSSFELSTWMPSTCYHILPCSNLFSFLSICPLVCEQYPVSDPVITG